MGKGRQTRIPGTENSEIAEVNAAAEAYVDARDARMKKTEKEVEAKEALIEVMKKHGLSVYKDDDATPPLIVTLSPGKDKVKVTRAEDEADDDDGEPEEES